MTNIGIDEVLNRLSVKFNRIFYDRDFVGCVSEDLQAIINNKNKCCVLVFPTLSPNYLRVVRYQAKLCDLAVIPLGTGSAKSVGVCHKKYFLPTPIEEDCKKEERRSTQMADNPTTVARKKRPPIQLYVPPAQRKSRSINLATTLQRESIKNENTLKVSRTSANNRKSECVTTTVLEDCAISKDRTRGASFNEPLGEVEVDQPKNICYCREDIGCFLNKKNLPIPYFSYQCNCVKFFLFKDLFPYAKLLIFSINRINHSFHWIRCYQGNTNILVDDTKLEKWAILNTSRTICKNISKSSRLNLFVQKTLDFREIQNLTEEYQSEFQNSYCLCGNSMLFYLPNYMYYCYLLVPDFEIFDNGLTADDYLHCFEEEENGSLYIEGFIQKLVNNIVVVQQAPRAEDLDIDSLLNNIDDINPPQMPLQKEISNNCDSNSNNICAKPENTNKLTQTTDETSVLTQINQVVVLDERVEPSKIGVKNLPATKDKNKQNEHEQEKEIMRKTKQNINRKTRPIIKYVDDDNDTLKIGKNDNVNSWEDLFNDEGELQEDVFCEIIQKVGPEVTIVKATEDYTAYASKHVEELEHMVELYDFPANLETHDIISAFSALNSDSMYVKWVDDTHAILVLGSYSQAQKAIELSNPLIKVRPMSAASSLALEKANQFDLKPAMKRPQTNLQTARRLITSHLGAKSKVSQEQSAKEREDLRIAKELKKQAKQNEKDAWEGNLRSSIN